MYNWYHSSISGILYIRTRITIYNYTRRIPFTFISPCQFPFSSLLYPLPLTWNPPSCDTIRPPRSQVACKLTSLALPFTQTLPLPNSQNPNCPVPHYDDLRNIPASSVRNKSVRKRDKLQYTRLSMRDELYLTKLGIETSYITPHTELRQVTPDRVWNCDKLHQTEFTIPTSYITLDKV